MIDGTHDPGLKSWVESANAKDAEFPIQNLPFATFRRAGDERARLEVGIGDQVLDVTDAFGIEAMLSVMAMASQDRVALRRRINGFLAEYRPGAGALSTESCFRC